MSDWNRQRLEKYAQIQMENAKKYNIAEGLYNKTEEFLLHLLNTEKISKPDYNYISFEYMAEFASLAYGGD